MTDKVTIDNLKAENDKYKKHNEALLKWNENLMTTIKINNQEIKQAEQKLERIREFATALCYTVMSDGVAILQKDILQIIDEVE